MLVSPHKRQGILKERYPRTLPDDTPPEQLSPNCLPYGDERVHGDKRESCARTYGDVVPSSYYLPFIEERVTLDLRDDAANPTLGMYFSLSLHEAVRIMDKSWNYIRVMPDIRGYVPIGLGMVLPARFAMGALFMLDKHPDRDLDLDQQKLGPQTYRLRGGGAQSNRGFLPGQLGDSQRGGIRSWESSLEWRVPLSKDFSLVGFGDMGDVYGPLKGSHRFRFSHLNTTFGGGLRYRTIVGPIRLDVGYRPRKLQRSDGSPGEDDMTGIGKAKFRGAIHLTIGEAF
jgi:outer membrane translocation and assembly module TamA